MVTPGTRRAVWIALTAIAAASVPAACSQIIGADKNRVAADASAAPASTSVNTNTVSPCDSTQKTCDGTCVSIDDPHYGCTPTGCDACDLPHVNTTKCSANKCEVATCAPMRADCNGDSTDGCEADLSTGPTCGNCTTACGGGQPYCTPTGQCVSSCTAPLLACDTSCVMLDSSASNCGSCGNVCGPAPHAVGACVNSQCSFACNSGWGDCDGNASNGCEVTLPAYFADGDKDGYGAMNPAGFACTPPDAGFLAVTGDCLDSNANVHPKQTTFFATSYNGPTGNPSFDYNCDNVEEGQPGGQVGGTCATCTSGIEAVPGAKNANVYCGSKTYASCVVNTGQTCTDQGIPPYECR